MHEGDPKAKTPELPSGAVTQIVGESGDTYTNVQVFNETLGTLTDHLVSDGSQPVTLAEGE